MTDEVKMVAIADTNSDVYVLPSVDAVNQNIYPVSRDLYIYSAGEPQGFVKEYIDWIMTAEAQQIVLELGFVPIQSP